MALMTHEGSGLGNSERDLRKICKGATFLIDGGASYSYYYGPLKPEN